MGDGANNIRGKSWKKTKVYQKKNLTNSLINYSIAPYIKDVVTDYWQAGGLAHVLCLGGQPLLGPGGPDHRQLHECAQQLHPPGIGHIQYIDICPCHNANVSLKGLSCKMEMGKMED